MCCMYACVVWVNVTTLKSFKMQKEVNGHLFLKPHPSGGFLQEAPDVMFSCVMSQYINTFLTSKLGLSNDSESVSAIS